MTTGRGGAPAVPSYSEVLRTPVFLPLFIASTLSTWGDYIARIAVAAVVFTWTGSALATAATFAVSLIPTVLGRALLSPFCDRWPPRTVMIGTHLLRAALVVALLGAIAGTRSLALVFTLVFVLELVGGPAITAGQIILTDLFPQPRLYARAFGLSTLAAQVNQAIGLALGGVVVGLLGYRGALVLDLLTFVVGAAILVLVRPPKSLAPPNAGELAGMASDLARGWREIRANRVLVQLLVLSLASALAISAPEAVAIPYASGHGGASPWGGLLMAAPVLGAVVGLLLIGRRPAERQGALVMRLALLMPLPLLVTIFEPALPVVWLAWFVSGALQCFMLPLQSSFTLLVAPTMRGRVFGLAGALSVGVTGACFLVAGWISEHTSPAAAVGVCAVVTMGILVLLAARWPHEEVTRSLEDTFASNRRVDLPDEPVDDAVEDAVDDALGDAVEDAVGAGEAEHSGGRAASGG